MRRGNIIYVAAALVLTLALSGGCHRPAVPDDFGGAIRFNTSSLRLSTGATKGGTTVEGTTFATDASFAVFGWHSEEEGEEKWIFDNKEVTCGTVVASRNTTTYTPVQFWKWANNTTDYYDFIAFYRWKSGTYTKSTNPTSVHVPYDATTAQYDLMAAGVRRTGTDEATREEVVPLTFKHLLCAVKVVVYNDSESKNFTLKSLHFKGLVVSDEAVLTLAAPPLSDFLVSWVDPAYNTTKELFGFDCGEDPGITVTPGSSNCYSWPDGDVNGNYNLLVPQTLTSDTKLEMSFEYDNSGTQSSSLSLGLTTIPNEHDGQLLTTWEAGHKYEYQIHIRVDGGVVVTVITTEWDPVEAQTHGIML